MRVVAAAAVCMLLVAAHADVVSTATPPLPRGLVAFAFVRPGGGSSWVAVAALDGSGLRSITPGGRAARADDGSPSWSPDGRKLAFVRTIPVGSDGESFVLYVADPSGRLVRRIFGSKQEEVDGFGWSPDSSTLALVADNRRARPSKVSIYVAAADGSGLRRLPVAACPVTSPDWSPNGSQLAYISQEPCDSGLPSVRILNVSDGRERTLVRDRGLLGAVAWSPDGTRIAFTGRCADVLGGYGKCGVFVVNIASGSVRWLTGDAAGSGEDAPPSFLKWVGQTPEILFSSFSPPDLRVVNADTRRFRTIAKGTPSSDEASLSRDGRLIAHPEGNITTPFPRLLRSFVVNTFDGREVWHLHAPGKARFQAFDVYLG